MVDRLYWDPVAAQLEQDGHLVLPSVADLTDERDPYREHFLSTGDDPIGIYS